MKKKTPLRKKPAVAAKAARKPAPEKTSGSQAAVKEAEKDDEMPQDLDTILKTMVGGDETKRVSQWAAVQCPYCGENFDVHFDSVEDGHSVQEDCAVCCKPIMLAVSVEDEDVHVSAYRA